VPPPKSNGHAKLACFFLKVIPPHLILVRRTRVKKKQQTEESDDDPSDTESSDVEMKSAEEDVVSEPNDGVEGDEGEEQLGRGARSRAKVH
jgi:hypothetical protein